MLRHRRGKGGRHLVTDSQAPNWGLRIQNHGVVCVINDLLDLTKVEEGRSSVISPKAT